MPAFLRDNWVRGALTFLLLWSGGCSKQAAPAIASSTNSASTPAPERQVFQVRGVIRELHLDGKKVVIKHEAIPNYMPAMTMPFDVKTTNDLIGLATNDQVAFTMIVTEKDGWIENVKKIGTGTNSPAAERPRMRLVREVDPVQVGDKMPDYSFTNSLGKRVSLSNFTGQAYAFTFIFTRCPFPTFCPRMNSNFAEAYEQMMKMTNAPGTNAPTNWHLFSISFDPDFDTPERLQEYSSHYHPDPRKWDWLTGAQIDIDAITEQVGLAFAYENGTFNHNLRTVVVDREGVIRKIIIGNEWKPEELVQELVAAAVGPTESRPAPSGN
ncbi:MAG TPA: SCO family protein [Verrucomicrobiae bacterium]|nr:SCO family protein [Verrucomicrobiae bacterium]